jgi:curved DNA binding protein
MSRFLNTYVIGASKEKPVAGKVADAMLAAHYASEVASRLVKPTATSYQVTDAVQKVAEAFGCKPIEGMLSHQLHRDTIDGDKVIIQNPTENQRKETPPHTFEMYDVFAVDVIVSTGEGKGREEDARTTVFKKRDIVYQLKLKASRVFFSEMDKRFALMPFTLRAFEDEKKARMGVVECVKHGLCDPYPVIFEREGEIVAQFKFTVLLMPSGPLRITSGPAFEPEMYTSDKKIEDQEVLDLLSQQIRPTKKQNKKKKKAAGAGADAEPPSLVPMDLNGGKCPCPH